MAEGLSECAAMERVTIPALLLASLIWAAESLSNIQPDEDDRAMIQEARRAIEDQAPLMTIAMMEADVLVDTAQFDGFRGRRMKLYQCVHGVGPCAQCGVGPEFDAQEKINWLEAEVSRLQAALMLPCMCKAHARAALIDGTTDG